MSSADYLKIKEVFFAALALTPEERESFLEQECPDEDIRREVELLFEARGEAQNFLQDYSIVSIIDDSFDKANSSDFINQKIDKYIITREIGRGGMGVVFLATREDFHQNVALKLIRRGMDSEAILERFKREREILASLNHPFIARLSDGGTTGEGVPFFVMEYVEGAAIDEYCRTQNPSEKEKLELFRKICSAVSFAHRKLVVHRDLKPSNILVAADGTPKLLDFGIAKLLNDTDNNATQTNQRVLTPAYASPEQMRGEIVGTTSDVYSLGKILSEILDLPASELSGPESERRTTRIKDRKTKNKSRKPKTDLQNIVSMALREDPARRYDSVDKFSDDIRRCLAGLPVSARKDSLSYRTTKFVERNKIGVAAAAIIFVLLISGVSGIFWEAHRARLAQARAEQRFNDVRTLVNSFLSELNDEMVKVSGTTRARQLLLQRTLEYLDSVSRDAEGEEALQRELAAAYKAVGDIQGNSYYQNLGDTTGALASYRKSFAIRERLARENPANAEIQKELAQTFESFGDVIWDTGDLNATLDSFNKAAKIYENLTSADPASVDDKLYLARIYTQVADIKYNDGFQSLQDLPGSLEENKKALEIREKLLAADPENFKITRTLRGSYSHLATLYRLSGDFSRSEDYLLKAERIVEMTLEKFPDQLDRRREAAVVFAQLAAAFTDSGEFEKAKTYSQKSLAIREKLSNDDKTDMRAQRDLAFGFDLDGTLFLESGNAPQALAEYVRELKIYENLAALDSANKDKQRDLVDGLISAGTASLKIADQKSALEFFNRALEISRDFPAEDLETHKNLESIYEGIGSAQLLNHNAESSVENYEKAAQLGESDVKKDSLNVIARAQLAKIYLEMGEAFESKDKQTARNLIQQSLEIFNRLNDSNALRKIDLKFFERAKSESV